MNKPLTKDDNWMFNMSTLKNKVKTPLTSILVPIKLNAADFRENQRMRKI
jgi:hypothetical protein